jgi:para-aminobenzoate synthetase component I
MNSLGKQRIPFLFVIDFLMKKPFVAPLSQIRESEIRFWFNGRTNSEESERIMPEKVEFEISPVSIDLYKQRFEKVIRHITYGNSYLLNLTCPSPIRTNLSLEQIYALSKAKYKMLFQDLFVVFSPEIFVQIRENMISSFPMKGTIDADLPAAREMILADRKETAEHNTIIDLIRNDISRVAKNVRVNKYRYIEEIRTNAGNLLQVSSEITGQLPDSWQNETGNILFELLPAGSISGAPKQKTMEIILETEGFNRGYYTGVCGIFDGKSLDSGVMIRFIEKTDEGFIYKSGGGITAFSKMEREYKEMIDKVYVPIN